MALPAQTTADRISGFSLRSVRVSEKTLWRHIELTDESGQVGTGEYSYNQAPADFDEMANTGARQLVGHPACAASLEPLQSLLGAGIPEATVFSALEQAIVDLEAKAAGSPVFAYFGSDETSGPVPLYANVNRRTTDRNPEGFASSARLALEAGYSAIKLAPFDGLSPEMCKSEVGAQLIADGLARIAAVAGAVSGRANIMVDCHWRFDPAAAMDCLDQIAELGVTWLECPLPESGDTIENLVEIRRAANKLGIRLAGLEMGVGWPAFRPFVLAGAYDVIMPDIKHAGGYRAIVEIADNARMAGTAVSLHNPSGPVAHQASVQLSAALETGELLEVQFDESPLFQTVAEPSPDMAHGACTPSRTGGLGLRLVPQTEPD